MKILGKMLMLFYYTPLILLNRKFVEKGGK